VRDGGSSCSAKVAHESGLCHVQARATLDGEMIDMRELVEVLEHEEPLEAPGES
jgi:hypothetical protein